jgi:hypothetical protein
MARLLLGALVAVVGGGCAGEGSDVSRDAAAAARERAEGALLRLDDFSDAWTASPSGDGAALRSAECALETTDAAPLATAHSGGFEHFSGDVVHHAVMVFGSDRRAQEFVATFASTGDCVEERWAAAEPGVATVREVVVPAYGDGAAGLRYEYNANGRSAFSDMVVIRVGDAVTFVTMARLYSPPDLARGELLWTAAERLAS